MLLHSFTCPRPVDVKLPSNYYSMPLWHHVAVPQTLIYHIFVSVLHIL